jgi:hypothetical protein
MVEGQVTEILDKQRGNTTQTPENRKKNIISGKKLKQGYKFIYTYNWKHSAQFMI